MALLCQGGSIPEDFSSPGGEKPCERIEQGGFARPVGADKGKRFAALLFNTDILQGWGAVVSGRDSLELQLVVEVVVVTSSPAYVVLRFVYHVNVKIVCKDLLPSSIHWVSLRTGRPSGSSVSVTAWGPGSCH